MRPYVRDYRFPLGIKSEQWEALKDEHRLHPDETPDASVMVKFNRYDEPEEAPGPDLTLEHSDGMTLQKVAEHFGLTRERIRQIEKDAFRKLRKRAALLGLSLEALTTAGLAMDNRE